MSYFPMVDPKVVARSALYKPFAIGSEDDEFDDENFSGWTAVEGTTLTVTESGDRCSVRHPGGGSASSFSGRLKAHTFSTNDYCEAAFVAHGLNQNFNMCGLTMSNGTTHGTSDAIHWLIDPPQGVLRMQRNENFNTDTSPNNQFGFSQTPQSFGVFFLRLRYEGSNNFRGYISPDGISWLDVSGSQNYSVVTPTHWGFSMTTWSAGQPWVMSLLYFRTGNG